MVRCNVLVLISVLMLIVGIDHAAASGSSRDRERPMKGWELYSWTEQGRWVFSLLEGTNRTKAIAEVRAGRIDGGLDTLVSRLRELERGDTVTWLVRPPGTDAGGAFALPPGDVVDRVRKACRRARVALQLPQP